MKHAVIVAHPDPHSFTVSVATAYCEAVRALGHTPILRDLYRMDFDPRLRLEEVPRPSGFQAAEDVRAEREIIGEARVFAFVYPVWFNAPPAILKGYLDRVFGMGFGYGPGGALQGRRMISFTSSGAPTDWMDREGGLDALKTTFDEHFARVCGLVCVDHVHFGDTTSGLREDVVKSRLAMVSATVERCFA